MSIDNINQVFNGATISNFALTIPSGTLISCNQPASGNPNEIIFGILENIYQAVSSGTPTNITASAGSVLASTDTYRRNYSFTVDLAFNSSTILSTLDVKPEPVV